MIAVAAKRRPKLFKDEKKTLEAFKKMMGKLPETSIAEAVDALGMDDPVLWTIKARRLKGVPYVFDVEKQLREIDAEHAAIKSLTKEDVARKQSMLLRHRPFLLDPLRDNHRHKVYMKSRQVGISELSLTEALCFLDTHEGTKWIYTFPREQQLQDFSNTRIKEALMETPYMRTLLRGTDRVGQKNVGNSHLLLRSAWESNLGEGIDADGVTLDEKDRMKAGVDVAFQESLSSSKYGYLREVSTPTLPGQGVALSFERSDQMCWLVKCERCSEWQTIEYPENVVQVRDYDSSGEIPEGAYEYLCKKAKCRGKLDRYKGKWVATYPSRKDVRGYHITQLICPWISATEVMKKKIKYKFMQLWENYVLGKTSKGEKILLTDSDFARATANYPAITARSSQWERISIGIDWGNQSWLIAVGKNRNGRIYILYAVRLDDDPHNELASVNQAMPIINPYDADIIVADAGYGRDRNLKLARIYGGRFFSCQYNTSPKTARSPTPTWTPTSNKVLCDRTATLKMTCKMIKELDVGFPSEGGLPIIEEVKLHLKNLAPINIEEDGEIYEDIQNSGPDHFAHALNYALLGLDRVSAGSAFSFSFIHI